PRNSEMSHTEKYITLNLSINTISSIRKAPPSTLKHQMKKLIFFVIFVILSSLGAKAQFEKSSWVVNPAITGLEYSYSDINKNHLGFNVQGGAFLIDDIVLMLKLRVMYFSV
ncbi:hypothetical protein EZS27_032335, partial [termite gut metagenome]